MLSEYRWAWRQVKTLVDEFKTNVRVHSVVGPPYTEHAYSGTFQDGDCHLIASNRNPRSSSPTPRFLGEARNWWD